MKNQKTIFANWKMNFALGEVASFCLAVSAYLNHHRYVNLVIAPPLLHVSTVAKVLPKVPLASQDVSMIDQEYGPYTGETSAHMLVEAGVKYAILGHCERRKYCGETDDTVVQKALNCFKYGLTPIICFGEDLYGQNPVAALAKVRQKLQERLLNDSKKQYQGQPIYAYEPSWAIGSNNFNIDIIAANLAAINNYLQEEGSESLLIYGGSVNAANAKLLKNIGFISGLLVGGASIEIVNLIQIFISVYD
jgi:triosephosphate isomerase